MKILIITSWYGNVVDESDGSFVKDQAKALLKQGVDVAVLYVDMDLRGILKKIRTHHFRKFFRIEDGIPTYRYNGFFFPKKTKLILYYWAKFYEELYLDYTDQKGRPDILHAHSYQAAYAASLIAQKYNIPLVITEHKSRMLQNKMSPWRSAIAQKAFDVADLLVGVSDGLTNQLKDYTTNNKLITIHNLIDTNFFYPNKKIRQTGIIQFISVGILLHIKGFDIIINAFSKLIKKGYHAQLTIIGYGPEEKMLEKLIKEKGLTDKIIMTGKKSSTEVAEALRNSDVFVHGSHFEAFGIVLIEALATGLPVIATKSIGPEDIINETNGILVSPNNIDEMFLAMEEICKTHSKYDKTVIRKYVLDNFEEGVVAKKLIEAYQMVLNNND